MIIDTHTHVFPDDIAKRALAKLEELARFRIHPCDDGTLAALLKDMNENGIDKSVVCPIATKPTESFFDGILRQAKSFASGEQGKEARERIIHLASVHPDDEKRFDHLKEVAEAGIKGVKLHPFYQPLVLDSDKMLEYFRCCRDLNRCVVVHCGFDVGFPADPIAGPERISRVIKEVPGLKFVAAHLGGLFQWGGVREHLMGKDVYLDTSLPPFSFDNDNALQIVREHREDRLLFATDWPWLSHADAKAFIHSAGISEARETKILGENAKALFGVQ